MPYAYGATINHVFDTDHLVVFVTFRPPMQRSAIPRAEPPVYDWYPPLEKWLLEADEVPVDIISSEWLDEHTLLLTSDTVDPEPTGVTLEYDGPNEKLCTTWGKQWEPWGPLPSYPGYPTAPALHNSTHENGGSDEINIAGLSGSSEVMTAWLDQDVKTTSGPTFTTIYINSFTHIGDPDTYFAFAINQFYFTAGGLIFQRFISAKTSYIIVNETNADIDFRVCTTTKTDLFKVDAGLDAVIIGDGGTTNYTKFSKTGDITQYGSAGFYPRRLNQSAEPSVAAGEMLFWRDSDDGKIYLVYNDPTSGQKKVELL